jgi:restriction system protein
MPDGSTQFFEYFDPLLKALRDLGGSARPAEARDRVAENLGIEDIDELGAVPSGGSRFVNRVNWARFYLAKAGLIDSSRRGVWALTERGVSASIPTLEDGRDLVSAVRAKVPSRGDVGTTSDHETETPSLDGKDLAVADSDSRAEILGILRALPPDGFERFCQRLLRESGFQDVHVTGKAGDGGIDGIGVLQVNPLVSFKVLFQCKRYHGSVSPTQVRDFRGAMQGRADKGIIITTGGFTTEARREAIRDGVPPIELVDADKLVEMLEELELGLKPVRAFEVDLTFFAGFE